MEDYCAHRWASRICHASAAVLTPSMCPIPTLHEGKKEEIKRLGLGGRKPLQSLGRISSGNRRRNGALVNQFWLRCRAGRCF